MDAIKVKCRTLTDINHSQIFLDPPLRVMKIKINYWNLVKLKSFCKTKETTKKNEKRTHRMGENICKQSDQQGISLKIDKQLMRLN